MRRYKRALWMALGLAGAVFSAGCQSNMIRSLRARDQLNKGVNAFKNANFTQAVENFKQAVDLDPGFLNARLYLATAYMSQWVPGAPSEENTRFADAAQKGFLDVLNRDANNALAIESLGSLAFNSQRWDDAKKWYLKLTELNSQKKEAFYTIGVINWTKCYQPQTEMFVKIGMKIEDPGPIKDKKAREELKAQNEPVAQEGIEMLQKALAIDPDYDDAMAYLNLIYRQKAYIADTVEENKSLSAQADQWMQKALETRKKKAEAPAKSS